MLVPELLFCFCAQCFLLLSAQQKPLRQSGVTRSCRLLNKALSPRDSVVVDGVDIAVLVAQQKLQYGLAVPHMLVKLASGPTTKVLKGA